MLTEKTLQELCHGMEWRRAIERKDARIGLCVPEPQTTKGKDAMLTDAQRDAIGAWESDYDSPEPMDKKLKRRLLEEFADAILAKRLLNAQLAEARRDAERICEALTRDAQGNPLMYNGHVVSLLRFEDGEWILYWYRTESRERKQARLGNGTTPALTTEARAIIDAARAAEEKTT